MKMAEIKALLDRYPTHTLITALEALAAKERELEKLRGAIRNVINHPFTNKDEPFGRTLGNVLGRLRKLIEGKDDKTVIMDRSVDRFVKEFEDEGK